MANRAVEFRQVANHKIDKKIIGISAEVGETVGRHETLEETFACFCNVPVRPEPRSAGASGKYKPVKGW